jgi:tripeptide aminopeptidase
MEKIVERFLKYVSFDTQSAVDKEEIPSTKKQFELANYIVDEL